MKLAMAVPQLAVACGVGELVGRPERAVDRIDVDAAQVAGPAAVGEVRVVRLAGPGRHERPASPSCRRRRSATRPVTHIDM